MRQALILAAMPLALFTAGAAQAQAPVQSDIVARGRAAPLGWYTTSGPDAQGRLSAVVATRGLDLATAQGAARMARRVNAAAGELCALAGSPVLVTGVRDAAREACLAEALASGSREIARASEAARAGHAVAALDVNAAAR